MTASADAELGLWGRLAPRAGAFDPFPEGGDFDVAVVGGGILGASLALHAAEFGLSVVGFEKGAIGGGSSGRSGGQVWAGLKTNPGELAAIHGAERGRWLDAAAAGAADTVFALIDRLGIDCAPDRRGTLQAVHADAALPAARARFEAWRAAGAPVEWLDSAAVAEALGTETYVAGWRHRGGGTVDPLAYVLGLAAAARARGARLVEHCAITGLARSGPVWRLEAGARRVTARTVVVATNALGTDGLVRGLNRSFIALESAQVATRPLPPDLAARVLPGAACASDTRRALLYFRRAPDGSFVMGGRGSFWGRTGSVGFARLQRWAERLFPGVGAAGWAEAWSGKVAMTLDHLPHVHRLAPGLIAALGFNGRGIAMATVFGRALAEETAGGPRMLPDQPLRPIALHPFHRIGVATVGTWFQLRDTLDVARSGRP